LKRVQRVLVIGSGGAGKSTFATRLARITGLPLIHLDQLFWQPGWIEPAWKATVQQLVAAERWVMDGNFGGTLDERLQACDTVVFLDLSRWLCLWRVIRRRIRHHGQARPDTTPGCHERLSWSYLWWIWTYPRRQRPKILQRIEAMRPDQRAVVLRSVAEVERYLGRHLGGTPE
jgi:adenylate kinase family enzyme